MFLLVLAMTIYFVGFTEFMLSSMLSPLAQAFRTSPAGASWLISSYACSYALAAPVFGYFSDRVNRERLLLVALLLFAVDGIGIVFAPSLEVAVGLRIFGGMASAALIPVAFALIADVVERERQAAAMGVVMLGMTLGIAAGPALAGILTDLYSWRMPFLFSFVGCLLAFAVGVRVMPRRMQHTVTTAQPGLSWLKNGAVLRPLIAKGAWNGTAVAAFLLSGQVLQQRYGFSASGVGLTVTAFGIGLGMGNLSAGWLRKLCGREEVSLVIVTVLVTMSISLFMLLPLPLLGSLACLTCWGAALGAGAPSSTVILAARAGADKGMVLAFAETLNNVAILCSVPLAMDRLMAGGPRSAMPILAVGLSIGLVLTLADLMLSRKSGAQHYTDSDVAI